MRVLFFAQVRTFTERESIDLEAPRPVTTQELWDKLEEHFSGISKFRSSTRLAQNHSYAGNNQTFGNDDEVALLSPVSGG